MYFFEKIICKIPNSRYYFYNIRNSEFLPTVTEAAIVSVIPVRLEIPLVVVPGSEVDEGFVARVVNEVVEVKLFPAVPPVLTVLPLVSSSPIVTSVAIARAVLLLHVEPEALHGVAVQDVSELCGVV